MRHAKRGRKLGRDAAHRKAALATMAGQVIQHGRIKTTGPKAKEVRGLVDKLIEDVAPDLDDRNSGYTRILKLCPRLGDGAEAVYLELVNYRVE